MAKASNILNGEKIWHHTYNYWTNKSEIKLYVLCELVAEKLEDPVLQPLLPTYLDFVRGIDDASDQMTKTAKFLKNAGDKLKSRRVPYPAMRMKFDPFGQLRENIDTMVVMQAVLSLYASDLFTGIVMDRGGRGLAHSAHL